MQAPTSVLVLGIGNILWADEGFGVRAVEALHRRYAFSDNVTLMDGGTQGIYLVQHVRCADILVVFDAIDYGEAPGTLRLIEGHAVPKYLGAKKVSLHQTGFQEVLALADMLGDYPRHLLLVGVQPVRLEDYGGSLSTEVKARIDPALGAALTWLEARGIQATLRAQPLPKSQSIAGVEIEMQHYEAHRPPPDQACRVGDGRVLGSRRYRVAYRPHPVQSGALRVDVDQRSVD